MSQSLQTENRSPVPNYLTTDTEVKPHASARDRVEVNRCCHHVQPAPCTLVKALGIVLELLRITPIQEGRQIYHWLRTTCQASHGPSGPGQCFRVILHSRQTHGYPKRQPIGAHTIACEPAEIRRLY